MACFLRYFGAAASCVLLAGTMLSCASDNGRARDLEATVDSLARENAGLQDEVATLRQEQDDFVEAQEAAEAAVERQEERLDNLEARVQELEGLSSSMESDNPEWSKDKSSSQAEGTALERNVRLVEDAGGEVHYFDHPERGDRTVLVMPLEFVDGETPLIVSLHGFGGDSAYQSSYVPLHESVNTRGFALLLPNGTPNDEGNRFWNPTDECCDSGKSGEDDVAYLTELVEVARAVRDFGPVYFFGYSNGGFMSYHMACKGLPGLRAVASLAGTSYVEDSSCERAPPVSVLHVHGTADSVILFDGDETQPDPKSDGETAFYAGAREMVTRWSQRAGCDWPESLPPYATHDLDQYVPGPETQAFRVESGCAEGVTIELWVGEGSGHAPGYGDAFVDALLDWLLAQE